MKAFIPLYMANVREFVRDRSALFWTAAFPVMFILIFGVIFLIGLVVVILLLKFIF